MYYLKLTLDERKTLTKISTRKPLTTVPQTSAQFGHEGTRKPANTAVPNKRRKRAACITGKEQFAKQGSSWHDITDSYRARKKAVNLRVESGDRGVTNSPKKVTKENSVKKTKVQEEPVEV